MHEKIRQTRLQAGLSQEALASATGISPDSIRSFENGSLDPEIQDQVKLARALGVSFYYLRQNGCMDTSEHIWLQDAMYELYENFGVEALRRYAHSVKEEIMCAACDNTG